MEVVAGDRPKPARFCADTEMEKKHAAKIVKMYRDVDTVKDQCEGGQWTRAGSSYSAALTCKAPDAETSAFTVSLVGDTTTSFVSEVKIKHKGDAESTFKVKSVYKGACPASMKPGDYDQPGEPRTNIYK
jgi:hypothetical protein